MATGTGVPVEEYLHTAYEPDCEYVEGELVDRNVGEYPHGKVQIALGAYLWRRQRKWSIIPVLAQRCPVAPNRYLIPDLCVIRGAEPTEGVLIDPETLESIVHTAQSSRELVDGIFQIEGTEVTIPLRSIYDED